MKYLILTLLFCLSAAFVGAQDLIYTTKGDVFKVKVIEINTEVVRYYKTSDPEKKIRNTSNSYVSRIVFDRSDKKKEETPEPTETPDNKEESGK